MIPVKFDYVHAATVDQAIKLMQDSDGTGKVIAGGHSLLPLMKFRLTEPDVLIDISRIDQLKEVKVEGERLIVGALVTHHDASKHPLIQAHVPLLADTASQIGDLQIRNRGTIGGNLAHADPAADLPAAAFALEAEIMIQGEDGEERMSVDSFIIGPLITMLPENSLVTGVSFSIPPSHAKSVYLKYFHPASGYPVVGVAAVAGTDKAGAIDYIKVALTGVGDVAFRAASVEQTLLGQKPSEKMIREAARLAAEEGEMGSDLFASAEYRENLCKVYTERALRSILL
ncbi:FAD binding domain-containing protein [Pseudobacillus badius]|uniref:FAD binding domain-containing protein n=1 Tax=Bacillus badius TaxID=1455 RepID=UPI0007B0BBD0|nr:xanthine dehydrogenase family protein subunit M [Bacillus badius]KZN98370.1 carbon monoxide dehydrogenase [Bacillus badius]MED0666858.1 xanthine dehydrogenase family protein subunit M [Bacillus badius]OCS82738.1 carbon monoxide dehydrogenase [Bacillus badius]OVE51444.1 carbon monoxide dehydrogenase [Bacillus badius]TDW02554.1 carbon-monoxide dehydrogenase medium subunit [Bacillus badius]